MRIFLKSKLIIVLIFISLMLTGCSNNDNKESIEALLIDKESSLTAQEKIRELLIMTKGNYSQLACIFNSSPSSVKRLYKGETFATPEAEVEINKYYNYFLTKGNNIENFKADCISYTWYNNLKGFMSNWWFWLATAFLLYIISFIRFFGVGNKTSFTFGLLVVIFLIYLIIWVINYFGGAPDYESVSDNFVNTMDTVWETKF